MGWRQIDEVLPSFENEVLPSFENATDYRDARSERLLFSSEPPPGWGLSRNAPRSRESKNGERDAAIVDVIVSRPDLSYEEIGKAFGLTKSRIQQIAYENEMKRPRGGRAHA